MKKYGEELWDQYQKHKQWWIDAVKNGQRTQEEWDKYAPILFARYHQAGMIIPPNS